jgi:hypothetical protein
MLATGVDINIRDDREDLHKTELQITVPQNNKGPFMRLTLFTAISCYLFALDISDGIVISAPNSLVSTDKIRLVTKSTMDLKTEAIDINIKMRPQKGLKLSSGELLQSFVEINGTLAAPRLAVDDAGVLVSGGAAVATGGLSILAGVAWDRLLRSKDPCNDMAEKGKEALGDRFPGFGY